MPNDYTNMADRFFEGYDSTNQELRATKRDEQRKLGLLSQQLDMRAEKEYSMEEKKQLLLQRIGEQNLRTARELDQQYPVLTKLVSDGRGGMNAGYSDGRVASFPNEAVQNQLNQKSEAEIALARARTEQALSGARRNDRGPVGPQATPIDPTKQAIEIEKLIAQKAKPHLKEEFATIFPGKPPQEVPGAAEYNQEVLKRIREETEARMKNVRVGSPTSSTLEVSYPDGNVFGDEYDTD